MPPFRLWRAKLELEHASTLLLPGPLPLQHSPTRTGPNSSARTGPLSSTFTSRFVSEHEIGLTDKPAGRLGMT